LDIAMNAKTSVVFVSIAQVLGAKQTCRDNPLSFWRRLNPRKQSMETLSEKLGGAFSSFGKQVLVTDAVSGKVINDISKALLQADVPVLMVKQIQNKLAQATAPVLAQPAARRTNCRKILEQTLVSELMQILGTRPVPPPLLRNGPPVCYVFVGLQGAGKTTCCSKFALYYRNRGRNVGLVCCDTFRAGAFDQLKQNCLKATLPFYGSYTESDPAIVAERGLSQFLNEGKDLVIVDTSGRHKQSTELFQELIEVVAVCNAAAPALQMRVMLVVDGSQGQALRDQCVAFKQAVDVEEIIVSKLDGHAKGGGALAAVAAAGSTVSFIGTGEQLDDLEPFSAVSYISRLMGRGDLSGLLRMIEGTEAARGMKDSNLMKKLLSGQGQFTFRDLYEQLRTMLDLGPLGKLLGKLPGFNKILRSSSSSCAKNEKRRNGAPAADGGNTHDHLLQEKFKRFLVMLDSFHSLELDASDPSMLCNQRSRIARIARGSGTAEHEVEELIQMFQPMKATVGQLQKMGPKLGGNSEVQAQDLNALLENVIQGLPAKQRQALQSHRGLRGQLDSMLAQLPSGGGRAQRPCR